MKSNLQLAAAAGAAFFAVVTLSSIGALPGTGGSSASTTPGASPVPLAYQATHNVTLPNAPTVAPVSRAGTSAAQHTTDRSANDRLDQPGQGVGASAVSTHPIQLDPAHPQALNDPVSLKPGALATGSNTTYATSGGGDLSDIGPAGVPLSETFTLASRPSSNHTLFLDPRGASITGRAWTESSASYYKGAALNLAAYSYGDTDPAFDYNDLQQLQIAWLEVEADYNAFDINVTLAPTADDKIGRSSDSDAVFGTTVLMTSTPDPAKRGGGIAWMGASTNRDESHDQMYWQPALDFSSSGDTGHNIAQTASHEAGHTWGLAHESGTTEYYKGSPTWAPIMGTTYYSAMGQWSKGEFRGARLNATAIDPKTNKTVKAHQDQVEIIRGVIGSAASDNAPDASPTTIDSGDAKVATIESSADTDTYSYTGTGGVNVVAAPRLVDASTPVTNVDLSLDVVDVTAQKVLTAGFNPPVQVSSDYYAKVVGDGLSASYYIPKTTEEHTYSIVVAGAGNGASPATDASAYSSYGSIGTYELAVGESSAPTRTSSADGSFALGGITALTRTPGVPIAFDVDYDNGTAAADSALWAWKTSKPSCRFDNAALAAPTLTCLATDTGAVTVTATVSASGYPTVTKSTTFALSTTKRAAPSLALSVAGQSSDTVNVCTGNAATVLGTVTDQYDRPVYGASVRLFTGTAPRTVKSDIFGHVSARVAAKPAVSYGIDTLASGVYAAQTAAVTRTVTATPAPCFTEANDTTLTIGDDVVAVPGIVTPLTVKVTNGDVPVTGVTVAFTDTYTNALGVAAVKTLGSATTDDKGVATYLLKATTTTPPGLYKATLAKSTITPVALASATSQLGVATSPTLEFDKDSFNINGSSAFTADGSRADKFIRGTTSIVSGRLTGHAGDDTVIPAGVAVSLNVSYTDPKTTKPVVKKFAGKTGANGWFRISVKDPVAAGIQGQVSVTAAKSTLFPAVAETPFTDSSGTQAVFEVKPWDLSVVPSATLLSAGTQGVTFTVKMSNPWSEGAPAKPTIPASVTFTISGFRPMVVRNGSLGLNLGGLTAGTYTVTPATSTAYTAAPTSFTVQ